MPSHLILGTAGHIDHGKTALVRALTGVDTDRLPEEKQRGISIDIGFAQLRFDHCDLGIVDVPGHERFIRNMLAGASGIDLALLVVAADDSIMPQTREHLHILQLLGLQRGLIAITKADLVDESTLELVTSDIRELVAHTFLHDAPIIPTSTVTGLGIDTLRQALATCCQQMEERPPGLRFRMAIDRAFTLQGHGTIVTGSVASGSIRVGDELDWHREGGRVERVRIRSLSHHGNPVPEVSRGQRAALNLAGVPLDQVHRGQTLGSPGDLHPATLLSARIYALPELLRPLRNRLPVHVHIGTAEVMGTIALLEDVQLEPGSWGLAQLYLNQAVAAYWMQPMVLRDSSAEHTLGGGVILQPVAQKIRPRDHAARPFLQNLSHPDPTVRIPAAVGLAGWAGMPARALVQLTSPWEAPANDAIPRLVQEGTILELPTSTEGQCYFHPDHIQELEERILHQLGIFHTQQPLASKHDRDKLVHSLAKICDPVLIQGVINCMVSAGRLIGDTRMVARPDCQPRLSLNQRQTKARILEAFAQSAFAPPDEAALATMNMGSRQVIHELIELAVADGDLVRIAPQLLMHAQAVETLFEKVRGYLEDGRGATVAEIRDLLGTSRKYAVPICEYLDRTGLTQREGDLRRLAKNK